MTNLANDSKPKRILILGEDTRAFLTAIRSLGRGGIEVHVAWCPLNAPSLSSKYIQQIHRIADYRSDDLRWLEDLNALTRQYEFDLVLPCHDSSILPLQTHREDLERRDNYCLVEKRAFEICFSKEKTFELAQSLGVKLPKQRVIHAEAELHETASAFGMPLVLKPYTSANLANPGSKLHVRKIRNVAEMQKFLKETDLGSGVLAQQNFIGKGVGVEVLCKHGKILLAFQHERVHEPIGGGGSSYRRSVPLQIELLDATRKMMEELRYTGVAMAEYKVNPSGDWILIEINARLWGSLPLSLAAGMNFTNHLAEMMCDDKVDFPQNYRKNLYARNWLSDFYWLKANMKADRIDPSLDTVSLPKVAAEFFNVLLLRETSDTFVMDDPRPAWREISSFFRTRIQQRTRNLEWSRKSSFRRAKLAVGQARKVLFLCKGNICRSPFAEAVLRKQSVECASAGYFPKANRSSPDAGIEAAKSFGIDLSKHHSIVVDTELMKWADLVFVFDLENEQAIESRWPEEMGKVHYLGALDLASPLVITDPYGSRVEDFEKIYARIAKVIQSAFPAKETNLARAPLDAARKLQNQ
jgi:protein-tyrosine-phosphatase/predicted ATP-grasp superfamily ATP-dependent carboligase